MNVKAVLSAYDQIEVSEDALNQAVGISEIDNSLLDAVTGTLGCGNFCSISAECNGGSRCDRWSDWFN